MARARRPDIRLKRAYERAAPSDGTRVLVDRLWPRGVTKQGARIDHWFKDVAPSAPLRRWFGHAVDRWEEFHRRYARELSRPNDQFDELLCLASERPVTLVFGARDPEHNNALVLREALLRAGRTRRTRTRRTRTRATATRATGKHRL